MTPSISSRCHRPLALRRFGLCAAVLLLSPLITGEAADAEVTLSVLYAVPNNFTDLHNEIARRFTEMHPDIKIEFRNPAKNYEEGIQQILRAQLANDTPDVAYIGLNQLRVLTDLKLAAALDKFASDDGGFAKLGYVASMAALGRIKDKTYALPFAVSTPILYVNEDLVRAAGGSMADFPKDWPGVIALGQKINALPNAPGGFSFQWDASGNWLFQALVNSHGGYLTGNDGCTAAFDDAAGKWALAMLQRFHEGGMPDLTWTQSRQAFDAGTMGIVAGSTSYVAQATRIAKGKFSFRTMPFPNVAAGGHLPAGGTSAVILAIDEEKQHAAWEYLKFATGPVGQTLMATYTGYMPVNQQAIDDPTLLGSYFKENPNQLTSIKQMTLISPWESWAGSNGLKIIAEMRDDIEAVIGGKLSAAEALPVMVEKVNAQLPTDCGVAGNDQ